PGPPRPWGPGPWPELPRGPPRRVGPVRAGPRPPRRPARPPRRARGGRPLGPRRWLEPGREPGDHDDPGPAQVGPSAGGVDGGSGAGSWPPPYRAPNDRRAPEELGGPSKKSRRRPTLPPRHQGSTIGAGGLN